MIEIQGAREHNLQDVHLELPTGCLIVFCGVSGSGKTSLAFDTLHVEAQRRYLEALALDQGLRPAVPAAVDRVIGLPPTIALAQRVSAPGRRSTVGTICDLEPVLRILFARAGIQRCPRCRRAIVPHSLDEIVEAVIARPEGSRLTLEAPLRDPHPSVIEEVERAGFSRLRVAQEIVRIDELIPARLEGAVDVRIVVDRIRVSPQRRDRISDSVRLARSAGQGIVIVGSSGPDEVFVDRPLCVHDDLSLPLLEPGLLSPQPGLGGCPGCGGSGETDEGVCPDCGGARLSEPARAVEWRGRSLPQLLQLPVDELASLLRALETDPLEATILADVLPRLGGLRALGLGHLPLGRRADRLSSSELQRLRLARQISGALSGVLYVLDEPAAGLDAALVAPLVRLLRGLVEAGNTVLAVEHDREVVRSADHVVEFGPGAGASGGRIVYQGAVAGLLEADTPTGRWLSGRQQLAPRSRPPDAGSVTIQGPWLHGSPRPGVCLPRGQLVAITGPSGSGKSTLLHVLATALAAGPLPAGVSVSGIEGLQRPVIVGRGASRSPRSSPATYVGLWDVLRELLASTRRARIQGLSAGTFSLNTDGGRCGACRGTGERRIALGPLPDRIEPCPVCHGARFEADVLGIRWKGCSAAELLAMRASDAQVLLAGHPRLDALTRVLVKVGLGYVPLGQPTHTLSGGEAVRLSLARGLARMAQRGAGDTVFLLDDPTIGLHPSDVAQLLGLLRELVDGGATVWLTTSDRALAEASDRALSLSPGAVDNSGENWG